MSAARGGVYGWFATTLWAIFVMAGYYFSLALFMVIAARWLGVAWPWQERHWLDQLSPMIGSAAAIASLPAGAVAYGLIAWVVRRRRVMPTREYLAMQSASLRQFALWLVATLMVSFALSQLSVWLERPVPDSMVRLYSTTTQVWALWLAVVIAAPLVEELLFRGFVYRGFASGAARPTGAIIIAAVGWALLHQQYEAFEIAQLFSFGLLLGVARWRSGSVWVPVAMHALINALALMELQSGLS